LGAAAEKAGCRGSLSLLAPDRSSIIDERFGAFFPAPDLMIEEPERRG
jgi:hypothetical protein